jgi:hypothetical protein
LSTSTTQSAGYSPVTRALDEQGQKLVVAMPRHKAIAWSVADRAEMSKRLAALGTTIIELSDMRELLGMPRLSEMDPRSRWAAPYLLMSSKGRAALAQARAQRAMYTEALSHYHKDALFNARHALGLRRSTPSTLRLCELRALYLQVGLVLHPPKAAAPAAPCCPGCGGPRSTSRLCRCLTQVATRDHGFVDEVTATWLERRAA